MVSERIAGSSQRRIPGLAMTRPGLCEICVLARPPAQKNAAERNCLTVSIQGSVGRNLFLMFRFIAGQIVRKTHKTFGQVDIFNDTVPRKCQIQIGMCKIPESFDSTVCK